MKGFQKFSIIMLVFCVVSAWILMTLLFNGVVFTKDSFLPGVAEFFFAMLLILGAIVFGILSVVSTKMIESAKMKEEREKQENELS